MIQDIGPGASQAEAYSSADDARQAEVRMLDLAGVFYLPMSNGMSGTIACLHCQGSSPFPVAWAEEVGRKVGRALFASLDSIHER